MLERTRNDYIKDDSVVIQRNGQSTELSKEFLEATFERNVKKYKYGQNQAEAFDDGTEYIVNNYGYRGPDFRSGVDILAAGCSQTYGVGVPEQGTWPAFLAKKLDMSYVNLSASGASIEWIVQSLFTYFHEFGHPKILALFVPDLFRIEVVINNEINTSRDVSKKDLAIQGIDAQFTKGVVTMRSMEMDINWRPKLSKRPFPIEDTIPPEEAIYRNFKHLMMLEEYCNATGIALLWTSWSDDVNMFIEDYQDRNYFNNSFICEDLFFWASDGNSEWLLEEDFKLNHGLNPECPSLNLSDECICYDKCHEELKEMAGDAFHFGRDRFTRGINNSHLGVHKHAHIADSFYKEIMSKYLV